MAMSRSSTNLKTSYSVFRTIEPFYKGGPIQISQDGEYMFCGCGSKVSIVDIESGDVVYSIEQDDEAEITAFALSNDDEVLVTASQALLLKQWDWPANKCTRTWKALHTAPVASMTFDSSSTLLATGGCDSTIKVWDIPRQYCTHNLKGSSGVVHLVQFHPDSNQQQLFSSSMDNSIRVWDLQSSQCVAQLENHFSSVTSLVFSPDSKTLISSGRDKICTVWDLKKRALKSTISVHESIESVVLLPEKGDFSNVGVKKSGTHFLTAGSRGVLRVWDASSALCVHSQLQPSFPVSRKVEEEPGLHSLVHCALVPLKSQIVVANAERNICLYDAQTLELRKQFSGYNGEVLDVRFLGPKDSHIVVATNSPQLKVFELASSNCQVLYGHSDIVLALDVFRRGRMFASSAKDKTFRVWLMAADGDVSCMARGLGHVQAVGALSCSRMKENFVVTGSQDLTIKVWYLPETLLFMEKSDVEKLDARKPDKEKTDAGKPDKEKTDAGKPDKEKTDAGKPDKEKKDAGKPDKEKKDAGKPEKEKKDAGKPEKEKKDAGKPDKEKTDAGKPDKEKTDAGKPDKEKTDAGKPDKEKTDAGKPDKEKTGALKLGKEKKDAGKPDNKKPDPGKPDAQAAGTQNPAAEHPGNENTKIVVLQPHLTEKAHDKDINSVAVSPNDKLIATGSQDRTAKLWTSSGCVLLGVCQGHKRGIWCVQFSPVDQVLATSSADGTVKIWDLQDFSCLKTFEGHDSSVLKVIFVSQGGQVLSSDSDGLLKLWTMKNCECVKTLDGHCDKVWGLHANKKDNMLVTGASDSRVTLWKDVTRIELEEQQAKREEQLLREQELSNLLHEKRYLEALASAISLDRPHTVLTVVKGILKETGGKEDLEKNIKKLRKDQKEALLRFSVTWNTNSRNCHEAQAVIGTLLRHETPESLLEYEGIKAAVESLLPYTERHFQRLGRLLQASMFLDFMWQSMRLPDGSKWEEEMDT